LNRTGDLAKRLPNGDIEFIGRADNQIKLRGFRIELGEIESAVSTHSAIKEAVVAVKEHAGEKKIVAYYVVTNKIPTENVSAEKASSETSAPAAAELREFLKQKLPEYMIPSLFIEVAGLSLNANGKIDRHKLPALADVSMEAPSAEGAAPKDELEIKLTRVWRAVLGLPTITVDDNFFECGGHSLIAVRLFSEIEKALGVRLPLATLFQAPTVERLAALIRAENWQPTWNAIVPLLPSGTKPPFFCIHAVGGNILEYNDLANHLSADQPFYGLQALGLDGKSAPLENIEEMADAYLQEIREIQPAGPYYLGGRSFGGTVAYEIARRLVESGEKVALLAILDSYPKGWSKLCSDEEAKRYKKEFFRLRIKRHLENWRQLGFAGKTAYFLEKANYKKRKIKNLAWRLRQKLTGNAKNSVGVTIRNVEEINYLAIKKYTPQVYAGVVTFFGAREEICPEENLTGWRLLAQGGVNVVEVPGDHQTMIKEPHVRELARALERNIEQSIGDTK
jgi:thioesterase domain-containing protein/acyl carrier protein